MAILNPYQLNTYLTSIDINSKITKQHEMSFELFPQTPYSPNLVTADFGSFLNIKKIHASKKYFSGFKVITVTNTYFKELEESAYRNEIKALEYRWYLSVKQGEDYVEINNFSFHSALLSTLGKKMFISPSYVTMSIMSFYSCFKS